ncbi:GspE/PulE family protein [Desulfonatronovibrio magnus]|uniref:GspE/PulE family protein n=1 Tax=Desulfonatronovibrio magnus TaxID=698827 RepID=UPI0006965C5D|nr:ATPase, T2SS/T4P/T4SS family [Desulfonatronovibrio magnus]
MKKELMVEFNKKLFTAFQLRGIRIGAVPDLNSRLISDYLLDQGKVDASVVNSVLEEITGIQSLDPTFVSFDAKFIEHITTLLPWKTAKEETAFAVRHENEFLHVAMSLPQDSASISRLEAVTGCRIKPYSCNTPAITNCIQKYYENKTDVKEPLEEEFGLLSDKALKSLNLLLTGSSGPLAMINDAYLIRVLQFMLNTLVINGSSDLHMEPREMDFRVRFRKDGVMQTAWILPSIFKQAILPRLKMLARMDLEQSNLPQDGSISFGIIKNRVVDIRTSSLPSLYGEKIVMRVLERDKKQLSLTDLGMESRDAKLLNAAMRKPTGLILVTGPTGSGKSTTLYAVLSALNTDHVNIVTAEDPVEYKLDGLTQVSCTSDTGLTFNEALRSFLRQDPDIIMVGEIRDVPTADIALKAAMTGHLVLSTLHTNDAPGAVSRLINMGIPSYLVASAQMTIIAQRLMRKLCEKCKEEYFPEQEILKPMGLDKNNLQYFKPVGCSQCAGTGYNGRIGIYELMQINDQLIELILNNQPSKIIKEAAVEDGMVTLRKAALNKLKSGRTTIEEVIRVTMD